MGSWNEVCFMSGLPIRYNDDVYAFVLMPRENVNQEGKVCYKDDKYIPIGFPIAGKYDDYGGIESIRTTVVMEEFFKSYEYIAKEMDEDFEDTFVPYKWESLQCLLNRISHRSIYVKTADGEMHQMELTLIHKQLYDIMLYEIANRIPYDYHTTIRQLTEDKVKKHISLVAKNRKELVEQIGQSGRLFAKFTNTYFRGNDTYRFMNQLVDMYLDTATDSIVQGLVDYILWMTVMNLTNKGYLCITNGSQNDEHRLLHIVAEFIISHCAEQELRYLDDNDDVEPGTDVLAETLYFFDN